MVAVSENIEETQLNQLSISMKKKKYIYIYYIDFILNYIDIICIYV